MEEFNDLFSITIHYLAPTGAVILLGLLGGKFARFIKLPKVTGYLLAGVLIGPSVLGLISHETVESLSIVSDIALGLIMFAIGGVFEIHHIKSVGSKALWLTIGQSAGAVIFTTVALAIVGVDLYTALVIGTIGIATAPAASLLVVREYQAKGDFTDTFITIVATSNIVCILAFELVFSLGEISADSSILMAIATPLYEIGGALVLGGLFGFLISKWEQSVSDQAELLMIIVAGVLLVTGLAFTLHLQPLLATLVMGAVTTNTSLMHRLIYIELRQIEQPLYIAFFVLAGASLHLELLPSLGMAGIAYLVFRVVGKVVGIWAVSHWKGFSTDIKKNLGFGMMVQAGVAIGLIDIVEKADPEMGKLITPLILGTVLIYETVGPPIIKYILIKVGDAQEEE